MSAIRSRYFPWRRSSTKRVGRGHRGEEGLLGAGVERGRAELRPHAVGRIDHQRDAAARVGRLREADSEACGSARARSANGMPAASSAAGAWRSHARRAGRIVRSTAGRTTRPRPGWRWNDRCSASSRPRSPRSRRPKAREVAVPEREAGGVEPAPVGGERLGQRAQALAHGRTSPSRRAGMGAAGRNARARAAAPESRCLGLPRVDGAGKRGRVGRWLSGGVLRCRERSSAACSFSSPARCGPAASAGSDRQGARQVGHGGRTGDRGANAAGNQGPHDDAALCRLRSRSRGAAR